MSQAPVLSLVVLAYNEVESLGPFLEDTLAFLDARGGGGDEVIVVDDGSTDGTLAVARGFAARDPRVRVVVHERNLGMGAGMRSGFAAARGSHLSILAGDGQVRAREVEKLCARLAEAEVILSVYGRGREGRELGRLILSGGFRLLMQALLGRSFELEGIYLFPVELAREIGLTRVRSETFFFSFELITLALERGCTVATVVIPLEERKAGRSKVANLRQVLRVARELFGFAGRRRLERCAGRP